MVEDIKVGCRRVLNKDVRMFPIRGGVVTEASMVIVRNDHHHQFPVLDDTVGD